MEFALSQRYLTSKLMLACLFSVIARGLTKTANSSHGIVPSVLVYLNCTHSDCSKSSSNCSCWCNISSYSETSNVSLHCAVRPAVPDVTEQQTYLNRCRIAVHSANYTDCVVTPVNQTSEKLKKFNYSSLYSCKVFPSPSSDRGRCESPLASSSHTTGGSNPTGKQKRKKPWFHITGFAFGGLVLLFLIAVVVFCVWRTKKENTFGPVSQVSEEPDSPLYSIPVLPANYLVNCHSLRSGGSYQSGGLVQSQNDSLQTRNISDSSENGLPQELSSQEESIEYCSPTCECEYTYPEVTGRNEPEEMTDADNVEYTYPQCRGDVPGFVEDDYTYPDHEVTDRKRDSDNDEYSYVYQHTWKRPPDKEEHVYANVQQSELLVNRYSSLKKSQLDVNGQGDGYQPLTPSSSPRHEGEIEQLEYVHVL